MKHYKQILITGGTGTIGHAILRKAVREGWKSNFVILSRNTEEQNKLPQEFPSLNLKLVAGAIQDFLSVRQAIQGCDLVIHAAGMKGVGECEDLPYFASLVNVWGSSELLNELKIAHFTGPVVLVSTAKAAAPASVYGATKMLAERLFQRYAEHLDTHAVRLGNILASNNSVLKFWREAIREGKPIPVTNPDMRLFWISADQAAEYIIQAIDEPRGTITAPMQKNLPLSKLIEYAVGYGIPTEEMGMQRGEKYTEILISNNEHNDYIEEKKLFRIYPGGGRTVWAYDANGEELTREEVLTMLEEA